MTGKNERWNARTDAVNSPKNLEEASGLFKHRYLDVAAYQKCKATYRKPLARF